MDKWLESEVSQAFSTIIHDLDSEIIEVIVKQRKSNNNAMKTATETILKWAIAHEDSRTTRIATDTLALTRSD